ncbi:hypothetical protein YC2023_021237 [Brassica napus]
MRSTNRQLRFPNLRRRRKAVELLDQHVLTAIELISDTAVGSKSQIISLWLST